MSDPNTVPNFILPEEPVSENVTATNISIEPVDVMTGDRNRARYLYYQLKLSMRRAERIDIVVSFLMESGVKMILGDLREALNRGVQIRILTGNYLGITQPSALYLIKKGLGDKVDLRFYSDKKRSFHPKAYIFHYKDYGDIFIGSSNVSRSALTSGIEWNYRFSSRSDEANFDTFYRTFEDLFFHHSIVIDDDELRRYSKSWHKPALAKDLERYERGSAGQINDDLESRGGEQDGAEWESSGTSETGTSEKEEVRFDTLNGEEETGFRFDTQNGEGETGYQPGDLNDIEANDVFSDFFQPRGAQIEALYALADARAEGAEKALVLAATGVGKTALAAFDSKTYEHVLFVAHREEILKQAARTFQNVRHSDDYGFFYGKRKDTDKAVIFASVATLGRNDYLNDKYFAKDYFDYLVIDEFHHAVNDQYRRIVNYFKPKFLLGLTATPERMDGRNIYEICDYNVPYEISLKEAINKGMLVPFHYYGIFDETDYSGLHLVRGRYDEQDLTELYRGSERRFDLIYKYYLKYRSKRALGFCCSRAHAEEMAKQFCERGIPSVAVYSNADGEFSEERDAAIRQLRNREIRVIFSVDMFNEGLDIDSLDMVMFLRPTESPVVFLQQLGRGLRICDGKEYLNVLDFIGNYEKAGRTPLLLAGENSVSGGSSSHVEPEYPDDCIVDFDMRLIDLFREMDKKTGTKKERIRTEYYRVKELLNGKVPTRMELFTYMDDDIYELCRKTSKDNPFRQYMEFLHENGELSEEENVLYNGIAKEFLSLIETTDMVKVYKMPILYSFYNHGDFRLEVSGEDVLKAWKEFFDTGTNWKDFSEGISIEEYRSMTDKQHLDKARKMPIRFLKASGKGFFIDKEGYEIAIREDIRPYAGSEAFRNQVKDILEYRTMEYYRRRYVQK